MGRAVATYRDSAESPADGRVQFGVIAAPPKSSTVGGTLVAADCDLRSETSLAGYRYCRFTGGVDKHTGPEDSVEPDGRFAVISDGVTGGN